MRIDSTVEDLVAKIVSHTNLPSSKIRIYRIGFKSFIFSVKNARVKNQTQKLFQGNNFEEVLLLRFTDEAEPK